MYHPIEPTDIERLASLAGVANFDEWKRHLENESQRISDQLKGSIDDAWANCLPVWLALGRVRDLSRSIRVPKYSPSYANTLGLHFADTFGQRFQFLIDVLHTSPVESHEYLCAFDLLDLIACSHFTSEIDTLPALFAIDLPIPRVVQLETSHIPRFANTSTVGEFLYRVHEDEFGDDD
ncbi:hypothetical protein [Aeoliella sp. SH292]|uniref:hypothetical protein n=1 Tax=Aeoliella sp. SH292 TaxID=3454464 RepID=UPI003F9BCBB2